MISFSFGFCIPPDWSPEKKIFLWGASLMVWGSRFDRAICLTWGFLSLKKGISCSRDIQESSSDFELCAHLAKLGVHLDECFTWPFDATRSLTESEYRIVPALMAGYNRTRYVEQLLEKTESLPPSFTVHLHSEYWVLNNGSKFLYHNQIAVGFLVSVVYQSH